MPDWGGIQTEIIGSKSPQFPNGDLDGVRRKYIAALAAYTGRNVIVYMSGFQTPRPSTDPTATSIVSDDLNGLMQAVHKLEGDKLDLIIHSPGGELAAAEAIVTYARSKFQNIRVIVPGLAMSAACLITCSADEIVMGRHSFLGPIDPQFVMNNGAGARMCAAHAILNQFELAKAECADQRNLAAWMPILGQYGPDVLVACKQAIELSENYAADWLARYMFRNDAEGEPKARSIASWLSSHKEMKTHGRYLGRDVLKSKGLRITDLEIDGQLQELVLSIYHATNLVFNMTPITKIIENNHGKAYMKMSAAPLHPLQALAMGIQIPMQPPAPALDE